MLNELISDGNGHKYDSLIMITLLIGDTTIMMTFGAMNKHQHLITGTKGSASLILKCLIKYKTYGLLTVGEWSLDSQPNRIY